MQTETRTETESAVTGGGESAMLGGGSSSITQSSNHPITQSPHYVDYGAPLPDGYGETRIVLLPRDPHWMHTYWEIAETTVKELKAKYGEDIFNRAQAVIRMHETGSQSDVRSPRSDRFMDVGVNLDARNWYLRADKESSSWFVELGLKTGDGRFILLARSNVVTLPEGSVSTLMDEKWTYIKEEMDKIWEAAGGGKIGMGSLELVKMVAQRWELISQISSWKGGVSSGISSASIPFHPPLQKGERGGFWLMADCELILYGATEPSATLTVGGKAVELNPDGTFSLRFALPDGKLALLVKAISGDRTDEREVHISVERKTEK